MDRDAVKKQMKVMYKKAADARAKGKREVAKAFRKSAARLDRAFNRSAPRGVAKNAGDKAEGVAPVAPTPAT